MDFAFEHWFEASPEKVAHTLLDLEYQETLADIDVLSDREVLDQEVDADGRVKRRVRCVLGVDLGGAKRFIGDSEPAWVEEARWDPETRRWDWKILPEVAKELLSASGYIEIDGSEEESVRIVSGNVKVRVPIYGGKVEAAIVRGLESAYSQEAEKLARWLGGPINGLVTSPKLLRNAAPLGCGESFNCSRAGSPGKREEDPSPTTTRRSHGNESG